MMYHFEGGWDNWVFSKRKAAYRYIRRVRRAGLVCRRRAMYVDEFGEKCYLYVLEEKNNGYDTFVWEEEEAI